MANMVESVLIPKDEYESLLEKVTDSLKENDSNVKEEEQVELETDKPNDGKVEDLEKKIAQENKIPDKNIKLSHHGEASDANGLITSTEDFKPGKSAKDSDAVKLNDIQASDSLPKGDKKDINLNGKDEFTRTKNKDNNTDADADTAKGINNVKVLLVKVPHNLKQSVKILADYIIQNGRGIIEWDDSLKFRYFKQVIPRTNFAKIISYAFRKTLQTPKAYTVFDRALKSIGISSVNEWLLEETVNNNNNNNNNNGADHENQSGEDEQATSKPISKGIQSVKNKNEDSVDILDGDNSTNKTNFKKFSGKSKESRFHKLKQKWIPY